jgi:Na+-translocating ferredoxin:NAD+ oxidoreductase RNF subunit RnfB
MPPEKDPGKDLFEQLSDRIMTTGSKIIPELFRFIATEDDAKLMLATPGTVDELAEKTGRGKDDVQKKLDELFHKGLMFKAKKDDRVVYKMCKDIVQFHDGTILWPEAPKEYHRLWKKYMDVEWFDYARVIEKFVKDPFTRVVPIGQSIKAEGQIQTVDDVMQIIDATNRVAVTDCTCRTIDGKCGHELKVCVQVGRSAEYALERGTGTELTKDEAKALIRRCDEAGLVHVIINSSTRQNFICNCCSDCCQTMPVFVKAGVKILAPSRFAATVDADMCTGCEACLDRCIFKALSMEDGTAAVTAEKCMGCGVCAPVCPAEAITLVEVRGRETVPA